MHFNKDIIIEKNIVFIGNNSDDIFFNIAYGIDRNFILGAAISATSIVINNQLPLAFHFFTDYVDDDISHRFKSMANKFHINIHLYKINTELLSDLPDNKWPCSAYFRLVAFDYLSEKINTLLYLDADIVCKGSITDLYELNFGNKICAIVPDIPPTREHCATRLARPEIRENYFNSGVMFTHLKNWADKELTEKSLCFIKDNPSLKYPDQDALNILLHEKTIILPRKFNCIYSIKSELKDKTHQAYKKIINDESVFIHYVGTTKPWNEWGQYPSTIFFTKAYNQSTWGDIPLVRATTPLQWKKKSKHEIKNGKFIKGILSRAKYIIKNNL
ncbi:glycosyltransferase [Pectobacterium polaris]|uniref:glycosyltransferase family 8 protein n=1 Tax=Pectobacterium polaris TaxID=2042057 RepID=UPI000EA2FE8C|nr:glycosyltransferase [Pectobacterium polaris]MDE8743304.1 glycosyltransferase [Pectobacterium polaris]MDE8753746.1 glycosyltransferase [Pectobacterium polaris]MDE8757531.1 glycosyltransferase [Pectobacterium polaris]RJL19809.1 lipopolysaccharide 1,2-glucosyltransferase [Pectobacterium polaris]